VEGVNVSAVCIVVTEKGAGGIAIFVLDGLLLGPHRVAFEGISEEVEIGLIVYTLLLGGDFVIER